MAILKIAEPCIHTPLPLPYFSSKVPAGFPSPADDFIDKKLNLNEYLIQHPAATFFCRVSGHSMKGLGIFDGDLLIVDRSISPSHGSVVIAILNGELTCKVLDKYNQRLLSSNTQFKPISIPSEADFKIEGVVIHSIRSHHVCSGRL